MSFFKKYNGTAHVGLMRLETLIWVLIYGGLLTLVIGGFMARDQDGAGLGMMVVGGFLALVGVGLIYVRSRLREEH
jgi:vacuolar-type H+-ATPase subunit I/STV1